VQPDRPNGRSIGAFRTWPSWARADSIGAVAVLVGDFGAIGAVGLGAMLESEGLDLRTTTIAEGDDVSYVTPGETEVVLLDRGMPHSLETAAHIAAQHPDVRVIVCSLDETTMLVYPGGGAEPFETVLDPPRLAAAIRERS
jgi:DNA-binding NarL/FixJ family response regulator